ncbi:hypothetical protein C0J52_23423 [Blattella germanica]|nr:hypothetical protein C0J52_23423 [Blattella germanica]
MKIIFKSDNSYKAATYFILTPIIVGLVALLVESLLYDTSAYGLQKLVTFQWEKLLDLKLWYYAIVQMFFSTQLGFGNIVTCAGRLYSKTNALTAVFYVISNLVIGVLAVCLVYQWIGVFEPISVSIPEALVYTITYDKAAETGLNRLWPSLMFLVIICTGFAAMLVEIWSMVSLPRDGLGLSGRLSDPVWVYTAGWVLYLLAWVIIISAAIHQIHAQVDYNLSQKFLSTLKPSRNWGPVDTIYRHWWVQWRVTCTKTGERDFTFKRRGTKDYTSSVQKYNTTDAIGTYRQTPSSANGTLQHNRAKDRGPFTIQTNGNLPEHVCWRGTLHRHDDVLPVVAGRHNKYLKIKITTSNKTSSNKYQWLYFKMTYVFFDKKKTDYISSVIMEHETCLPSTSTSTGGSSSECKPSTSFSRADKKDDESDVNGEFYFESEHLALKGNKDYLNLLKTIALLEAQRTKSIEIPNIDWSAYNVTFPAEFIRPQTRKTTIKHSEPDPIGGDLKSKVLVRGRIFDDSKPETFNQVTELQNKCDDDKLESNTVEYQHLALLRRGPTYSYKHHFNHRHQRYNHFLYRQTTFFPQQDVPVYMSDFDDDTFGSCPPPNSDLDMKMEDDKEDRLSSISIDFCTDCVVTQLESSKSHPISHRLIELRDPQNSMDGWDQYYKPHSFSVQPDRYNYLDPNFMPD